MATDELGSGGDAERAVPDTGVDGPLVARDARAGDASLAKNLGVILDIDLPLVVRFGETQMLLGALTELTPGSVIDLARSPDDPVDVLVNGKLVARGEVVVVAGSYGVRITDIVNPADRIAG